jgi:PAS domain S-box-containing protein
MVFLALVPTLGLCAFVSYQLHRQSVARIHADAQRMAELAAAGQEGMVESTRQLLVALGELPQIRAGANQPLLNTHFRNLLFLFPSCLEFGLAGRDGQVVANSFPQGETDLSGQASFLQRVVETRRFGVGSYDPGNSRRPAGLWFGLPITGLTDGVPRVLYAVVDVQALKDVAGRAQLPAGAELIVCDAQGTVLAHIPDAGNWVGQSIAQTSLFQRSSADAGESIEETSLGGERLMFGFAPVQADSAAPLKIWVGIPKEAAFAETRTTFIWMLLLLGLAGVVAWTAARWYASVRILRPVNQLVAAAERLGTMDWTARTGLPHDRGELGQLAGRFDELARKLELQQEEKERSDREVRAAEMKFRTLVEQSLAGIYIIQDGNLVYVNPKFCEIVGRSPEELLGKPVLDVIAEEDRAMVAENIRKRLEGAEQSIRYQLRCVRPDGTLVHVEAHGAASESGGRPAIIGILLDISEQLEAESEVRRLNAELEQRVKLRTAQLEVANKELEAFSYSVSHDLRAPLRHIDGFVNLFQQSAADQLDEKGRRYLHTISDAARRMGCLIDDLLAFSRMGRTELQQTLCDTAALVAELTRDLAAAHPGRRITWQVGPLPEVRADPPMLRQVFTNLLSNAVKYSRDRDPAIIEVRADTSTPGEVVFSIRDNGVGFDPRYAHKLFGVFQRLHRNEEFEGTGIGLANVRRIVARHGGRTWAEGRPGEGAVFCFTLPATTPC